MKLLITGSTGFIGSELVKALNHSPHIVVSANRFKTEGNNEVAVGEIDSGTSWLNALSGCDVVVHLAARAHVMQDEGVDALAAYRSVNTEGTLNLVIQAAKAGVRRFVFVSSIGVNGRSSKLGQPFSLCNLPHPENDYALSKYEAEIGLRAISAETGIEFVIIRPPLVYGADAPGNFSLLIHWLRRGLPLPLGAVTKNRRSFVAIDNLLDLLIKCIDHPAAANQTFFVCDGENISTTDLLRRMGRAMGKSVHLLPVPPVLLMSCAKFLGKGDMAQSLLGNLEVDMSHTVDTLAWKPPIGVDEGLRRALWGQK